MSHAHFTFDAVAVFWLKEHRLYRVAVGPDGYDFAYVGVPEELRTIPLHYAFYGLLGFFLLRAAKRKQERLEREAADMRQRIESSSKEEWSRLHPLNFHIPPSEIRDSRIVASVFHAGYGTFWRFRTRDGKGWAFRILGADTDVEAAKQRLVAAGAAAS